MRELSQKGKGVVEEIARRHGLQVSTVQHMLEAVRRGGGTMAQFDCAELGGSGQWMRGGMTMVGDMFNHGLKARVDRLCDDLSGLIADSQIFEPVGEGAAMNATGGSTWWPEGLGAPFSSGSQNQTRYAVFPGRLAVEEAGRVTVYDTLHYQISGVSQQQGGSDSMSFSSQFGTLTVDTLPVLSTHSAGSHAAFASKRDSADTDGSRQRAVSQSIEAGGADNGEKPADVGNTSRATITDDSGSGFSMPPQTPGALATDAGQTGGWATTGQGATRHEASTQSTPTVAPGVSTLPAEDPLSLIEKLARLHAAGVLTDEEFATKKTELLARL